MPKKNEGPSRTVAAVHGIKDVEPDPGFEIGLSDHLRATHELKGLIDLYARFSDGLSEFDATMRRAIWRASANSFGNGVTISDRVGFKHVETFQIGNGVFFGSNCYIQGRFDGTCIIEDPVWIGPNAYFDARDLVLGSHVGWGPGAKVLGSTHTGVPVDIPTTQTELLIRPVRVEEWADVGTGAIVLPGITIGKGSIVGAGAVVTKDVAPFSVVVGVPARFLRWREGYEPPQATEPG